MSNDFVEDVKHEAQRGTLLLVLIARQLDWVPGTELRKQMARLGYPMTDEQLNFQLNYCEAGGYLEKRMMRSRAAGLDLLMVRATKKAVDLHDGRVEEDQGIAF